MSGIERVGNSSSTGPTLKSGEKSQFGHQINIMKQNPTCKSIEQKKPVSQQRNIAHSNHNQTMQQHQHMGDELINASQSITHTMESTHTLCGDSQEFKKRSVLGHRYSAAVAAI